MELVLVAIVASVSIVVLSKVKCLDKILVTIGEKIF